NTSTYTKIFTNFISVSVAVSVNASVHDSIISASIFGDRWFVSNIVSTTDCAHLAFSFVSSLSEKTAFIITVRSVSDLGSLGSTRSYSSLWIVFASSLIFHSNIWVLLYVSLNSQTLFTCAKCAPQSFL